MYRLQKLSEDLLDIARIESGKFRLSKTRVDIGRLIGEIVDDYRHMLKKQRDKKIKLVLAYTHVVVRAAENFDTGGLALSCAFPVEQQADIACLKELFVDVYMLLI